MVKSCFHDEEVGKHPASSAGVNGMSVLWLDSAILVNEGSEAREFSGWELQWWGRTVGGGLLGASVVGGWLLGTPVVGLFGWAVVGSSLDSLHVCVSRGTSVASVDVVVVVSMKPCGPRAPGGSCGPGVCGFRLQLRGRLLPHRGERLQFVGLWVIRWSSWWCRGAIRASSISTVVASCLAMFSCTRFHVLQLSSMLVWPYGFSAGGTGACFPQKLIIMLSFWCGWRPLFRRGRPRQGAYPPWIGVSPVLGGG